MILSLISDMCRGPPLNVREIDVTDKNVKLMWSPPNEWVPQLLVIIMLSWYHAPPHTDVTLNTANTTIITRGIIPVLLL